MASIVDTMRPSSDRAPWWAGQEEKLAKVKTPKAALKLADADWGVEKKPLYAFNGPDDEVPTMGAMTGPAEGFSGLVRTDVGQLLYIVGDRFKPVQNGDTYKWALAFGDPVGVWVLRDGRVVGSTLRYGGGFSVGGQTLEIYVHALNWHGAGGLEVHASYLDTTSKVVHVAPTAHVRSLSTDPVKTWAEASGNLMVMGSAFRDLCARSANQKTVLALYERIWPKPTKDAAKAVTRWNNRRDEIIDVWLNSENVEQGTAWGVFSAVAEWAQWGRSFRGSGGDEARNDQLRGEEILFGFSREIHEKALSYFQSTNKKGR